MNFSFSAVSTALCGSVWLAGSLGAQGLPAPRPTEPVTLNFVNADIEAVGRAMANLSGRVLVIDPKVKGSLTLGTDKPVSPALAFEQFGAALRAQGYAVVETQGIYKIVPEADAKLQSPTVVTTDRGASGHQIMTQIFQLQHENAQGLVTVLRPLISPNNTINVAPNGQALVITDYADNLRRLGRIIAALDQNGAGNDVDVIPLQHALASDLAPMLQKLLDGGTTITAAGNGNNNGAGPTDPGKTWVLADPRHNALLVRGAQASRLAGVRAWVEKLDRPHALGQGGNLHVVYLKNADATQLAITLRAALAAENLASGTTTATAGNNATANPSTAAGNNRPAALNSGATSALNGAGNPSVGGQIQADPASNALVITAPEPQYRQLRAVIEQLDVRRAQVYVESLIAEVNADKAAAFGVQWQGVIGQNGSTLGLIGQNSSLAGSNLLGLTAGLASGGTGMANAVSSLGNGLNVAVAPQFNGKYYLGALANFLQSSGDGNVLSTPTLLTLDNEEARIVIGQNVPFVTGQYTNNNTGNGAVNPFQTIERKDVGLTLRVRPQVSENGTVKMTVFQEASSLSNTSSAGLITNKRSIESTVLVEDGSIVVLGGLLQDDTSTKQDKVPGLSDLPWVGALFRSQQEQRKKTNLMVFLRPVVLRDGRQSSGLAWDRYEWMRTLQQNQGGPSLPASAP